MVITDDQNEIFDVVDGNDRVVGRAIRREVHRDKNLIHRSIGVAVFNSEGKLFLQQRSSSKDTDPGKWTISCSGHVLAGEGYIDTVLRELREELGLNLINLPISLFTQRNRRKKGWPNAGFLISLTSGDREGPRLRDKPFPSPSPLGKRNNKKPARANALFVKPVGKYLCPVLHETEMVMLFRTKSDGPFKLNPAEIIQGKFFTRKELEEAVNSDKIKLSFMSKVALEKLGWM